MNDTARIVDLLARVGPDPDGRVENAHDLVLALDELLAAVRLDERAACIDGLRLLARAQSVRARADAIDAAADWLERGDRAGGGA